jgi:hypothetical protein
MDSEKRCLRLIIPDTWRAGSSIPPGWFEVDGMTGLSRIDAGGVSSVGYKNGDYSQWQTAAGSRQLYGGSAG